VPELPEVETIRRGVESRLVGRVVLNARLFRRDVLVAPGDPAGGFARQRAAQRPMRVRDDDLLIGATVTAVHRRGKQLAIVARWPDGAERALGVQLGMTGHLGFEGFDPAHVHAEWEIAPGPEGRPTQARPTQTRPTQTRPTQTRPTQTRLVFSDPRRFGGLRVFRSLEELDRHWGTLGPDALGIRGPELHAALRDSQRAIKAALLDQRVLAGVGNIYADEALFEAGIPPRCVARRLDEAACERLAAAVRRVLGAACERGGSTLRDFTGADGSPGTYQNHHLVYGRAGLSCTICHAPLRSALIAQRTTVWCGQCQPPPSRPGRGVFVRKNHTATVTERG
jgi:formamidopyrimidine-DNA glycosylase